MSKLVDVTGQRFGSVTALFFESGDRDKRGKWVCRCDCGNITRANPDNLRKMKYGCRSCAIMAMSTDRADDLVGQRFSSLVVAERDLTALGKGSKWRCVCDCGETHVVSGGNLRSGRTTACQKCVVGKRAKERERYVAGDIPQTYWNQIRNGAQDRGIHFDISPEFAYQLFVNQNGLCALTGETIAFRTDSARKHTASLDRIDSSKGYVNNNIQWVHKTVNLMKNHLDQTEFLSWCKKISDVASQITEGRADPPA